MENRNKNEELQRLKKQRIDIYSSMEIKKFDTEQFKSTRKQNEANEIKKKIEKDLKHLMEIGAIDDPELMEDFQIKKEGTQSLRNLKVNYS
jgi:hypothetical protein